MKDQIPIETRECVVLENQGQKIFGILHRPAHLKKCPAVLICHGLGGHKVGRYRLYVELSTRLSALGIATLRFDFRGSGDSEGKFADMTIESEVSDALVALNFLRNDANIDPERIGIFGRSLGGLVSVLTACQDSRIKTLGLWAPIFDSSQWAEKWNRLHSMPLDAATKQTLMTVDGQVPGYLFYKQFFQLKTGESVTNLNGIPLLLIHGSIDNVVSLDHAEQYLKTRVAGKGETKYIELPQSDHDFTHLEERTTALEETCRWFERTL